MQCSQLSVNDQQKINRLLLNFSRSEPNLLKFSQLTMLLLERGVFCHRCTFKDYIDIFQKALTIKNQKELGKDQLLWEKVIGRQQFIYVLLQIAKMVFKTDPKYRQKFFQQFLIEKVQIVEGEFNSVRAPNFDDVNKKLCSEDGIGTLAMYQNQLKNIYISYMIENYFSVKKARRLLLSEREISLQNKKWGFTSVLIFLKQSETIPHLISIEHIEDVMKLIVPPTNNKQQQFYMKHILIDSYQKETELYESMSHYGDVGLLFHEFMLFVGRIAWESYPKDKENKNVKDVIEKYFTYTHIRKNQNIKKATLLPNSPSKLVLKMKDFYLYQQQNYNAKKKIEIVKQKYAFEQLIKQQNDQIMNAPTLGIDFEAIAKALDKQLPQLPPIHVITQEQQPPYDQNNAITIGKQPPLQPISKQKNAKQEKKKSGSTRKDEIPPRVFIWEEMLPSKIAVQDQLKAIQDKLSFEVSPLHDIKRGTLPKESYPVTIGETLFPRELPQRVEPYIKQALNAVNDRNFVVALQSYENGLKIWKQSQVQFDPTAELFFQYSKANLYLSIGKLEPALQIFYSCRKYSQLSKLAYNNPDRSLPFMGLGQVFYEMREYGWATRTFLKARQIRQEILGLEHVQTGIVFNNLACCYFMLERSQEALGYIEIAEVILDAELGQYHERTMTCKSNYKKILNGKFQKVPQYRKFWQVFNQDKFQKKTSTKQVKKKK